VGHVCPKQNCHHRGTEDTERGYFFVYRDLPADRQAGIPIDENDLSNEFQRTSSWNRIFLFVPFKNGTNKKFSLCPLCLCGETDFRKKKPGLKPGFFRP
jgi:hypothetical protein